jgi:hypothetical protein
MSALICVCVAAAGLLGWIVRAVRAADKKVDDLIGRPTPVLPPWHEFLNPQAAHDQAVIDALEEQFQDGAK